MHAPLVGLESMLAGEGCERVELHNTRTDDRLVFRRQGDDAWAGDGPRAAPLTTAGLLATIQKDFGQAYDGLTCFLPREQVAYSAAGGSVRVKRAARAEAGRDGLEDLADALGIPRSKRKAKLKQARHFGRIVELALGKNAKRELHVLDLACGRSYLGLVLVHLLVAGGRTVSLHGVDSDPALVSKSREIVEGLQWPDSTFEVADLATYSAQPHAYDIVVSLHGCDTLTDEAIRIGCEARAPLLFVAPCCQHELRYQWQDHPLQWISRYGLLEQGLADVLTDGFRCLVLEALGYQVKVIRFVEPDVTPKNLLIQGRLTSGPRPDRARQARAFLKRFGVRPTLAALLDRARPASP